MINSKVIAVTFISLIIPLYVNAQSIDNQFNERYYTSSKGLSNNTVLSLASDLKGYLWIGTEDGLNRFDGKSFKIYRNIRGDRSSIAGNYIRCLYFDRDSTLWIGTNGGGLSRYDRKTDSFHNFGYKDRDSTSLSQMDVSVIFQDREGVLWIGTDGGGLNKFNYKKENFTRYNAILPLPGGLSSAKILDIAEDTKGRLLLASWDGGLTTFDKEKGVAVQIEKKGDHKDGLIANNVWSICNLGNDQFLLGFYRNGLQYFNGKTGKFKRILFSGKDINPTVYSIIRSEKEGIYFGTQNGLFYGTYRVQGDEFQIDLPLKKINDCISYQLILDNEGSIWAVNYENGFIQMHAQNSLFHIHQLASKYSPITSADLFISAFSEDQYGRIILGNSEGALIYDPLSKKINYSNNISYSEGEFRQVKELRKDEEGNVWVARNYDMARFNPKSGNFETYFTLPTKVFSYARNGFTDIRTEGPGKFWLATENGLYYLDKKLNKVETIIDASAIYRGNNIYQIVSLDSDADNLYVGTHEGGMAVVNKKTRAIKIFQNDPSNAGSITDNHINQIYVDRNDSVWLITYNGLDRFNKLTNEFKHYNTRKFQDQYFKAIIQDNHGNLWISSNDGISKFIPSTGRVTNYYFYNQNSQSSFQPRAAYKSKNGILYFGQRGTFISFDPDSIQENPRSPKVLITDFKINNQSVKVSANSPLKENIEEAKLIKLNYNVSSFSFSFAATDLIYPERNQYAYRLENFEDWIYSGNNNSAIYTNIPPGKYTFRVMASNEDGVWNEEGTSVQIWISPPWWNTLVFRFCAVLTLICIIVLWYYWNHRKIIRDRRRLRKLVELRTSELNTTNLLLNDQNEKLERQTTQLIQHREELQLQSETLKEMNTMLEEKRKEVERQNLDLSLHRDNLEHLVSQRTSELEAAKQKAEESDHLKSAFLANMSHEIRTPLNAIVGFSYFFSDPNLDLDSRERFFKIIKANSDALLVLIDDILDLSRIESGQLQFKIRPINSREFMEQLHEQFSKLIKPNLEFILQPALPNEDITILSDPYRFKQILNNLLSNAFKFTDSGVIQLGYIPAKDGFVTFFVKDTGIGIEPDKQEIIFERFMKIEGDKSKLFSGTGLGLAISKRLAYALGGSIWVESEAGKGSSFYFTQPATSAALSLESNSASNHNQTTGVDKHIKIALAEDDEDSMKLMLEFLNRKSIEVVSFRNGLEICEYFEQGTKSDVQLILMDIKMPLVDGYEAARRIRKKFPYIPIVAHTAYALANEVEKMKNEGFIHIMTKPVNFDKLSSIIDKL
jgi:signal transduction histidine kinase/ligand-binding sensor domain-containing protein/CheY-like chemotaxis protein